MDIVKCGNIGQSAFGSSGLETLHITAVSYTHLGYLIYFFEKTTAVSGYVLGINPFDQPGVESYKRNMFALLGKPGYEDLKEELEARL